MAFVRKIDRNGYFIEDAFVEELTADTIKTPCPAGFYLPRWDGTQWIEGKTTAEIAPILAEKALAVTAENNRTNINDYLKQAIIDNKAYIALDPTTAQQKSQLNKLTRQIIRIERLLLNDLASVE